VLTERDGRSLLWCSSCQDKAALASVLRAAGGSLPSPRPERLPRAAPDAAGRIERALALWNGAEPIEPGTPAALYLAHRRISHVASSPALRWRSDTPHPAGGRRLALLAEIIGPDGKFAGVQRIFLDRDGNKANCEPVKASLGAIAGGAVRLQDCSGELAVGEGVESAAGAGLLLGMPAWAAISAGNMARSMALPASIRSVVIAADHDDPGIRAAEAAWRRWRAEGRHVRLAMPKEAGADFADLAMGGVR
jgi:putative DNA primase/helicase